MTKISRSYILDLSSKVVVIFSWETKNRGESMLEIMKQRKEDEYVVEVKKDLLSLITFLNSMSDVRARGLTNSILEKHPDLKININNSKQGINTRIWAVCQDDIEELKEAI